MLAFCATAQDKVVTISGATASSYQSGDDPTEAVDGNYSTIWHSSWGATPTTFPVTFTITLKEESKAFGYGCRLQRTERLCACATINQRFKLNITIEK